MSEDDNLLFEYDEDDSVAFIVQGELAYYDSLDVFD